MKNYTKKSLKASNGITLIALVITIIVLLILAGISISMLSGDNSILQKATDAKQTSERAEAKEQAQMDIMAYIANKTANHQDSSLDDEKVKEILSDNKSYVKEAKATSFVTAKGEYEIPYSELYQSSNVTPQNPATPTDKFATLKTTIENSSENNVQINEKGEISSIVWNWITLNDEECVICGYEDDDENEHSGYYGSIVNGELENGFPIFIKSNNKVYRVTSLGWIALKSNMNIKSITIPEGVTSIGNDAFAFCSSLEDVTLPETVVELGYGAFRGTTSLSNINLPDNITKCGSIVFGGSNWENSQPDGPIYIGKVFYVYKGAIPQNTTLTLNEGTVGIANDGRGNWFRSGSNPYISNLISIIIPETFENIPSNCFILCSGLTNITINKAKDSISGAPWGAPNMTANDVNWNG